jgi:hypothetical protein
MKTIIQLFLLCCLATQLSAQNWKTVQSGRKDYFTYQVKSDSHLILKMLLVDSVTANNGDSIYYFTERLEQTL